MSTERDRAGEPFLSRWARLKSAPEQERAKAPAAAAAAAPAPAAQDEPPPLPPIEELTADSDFRGFLHPKVNEDLRRAALRKLFSDPHFNVMDGLDVYIGDYTQADPIPPEMLAGLKQAQKILRWAEGKEEETDDASAPVQAEAPALLETARDVATAAAVPVAAPDTLPAHDHKGDHPG